MKLSIIIVSWKVKDFVEKCLASIYKETKDFPFEVIVVDNDSNDGTVEMVKEKFPEVVLLDPRKNLGFAAGNNLGLKHAKGEYVLLLNPDTAVLDNALNKSVSFMEQNLDVDVMSCKLLYPDGTLQENCRRFPDFFSQAFIMLKLHNLSPEWGPIGKYFMKDFDYTKTMEVDQIMGAFILSKKEVYNEIGGLDEDFFLWFEEVDWCKRVKQSGKKIVFWPDAEIIHHKGRSFNQSLKRQMLFNNSLLHYFKKHHSLLERFGIIALIPLNLLADLFVRFIVKLNLHNKTSFFRKKKNL